MDWGFLAFLAEPWFVAPWYALGILGALLVFRDIRRVNTPLKQAMKWAWPIIVLFFSVLGLALYYGTARAPGIGRLQGEEGKQRAHDEFEKSMFRRVNGAVIHCVAGDGLGIMTGMVIARVLGMGFWQEFWFEYAVGFAFGLFIFQYKSMRMMSDSPAKALAMAFRAEFFSMLTVMAGMGAVMAYVTPMVITAQPKPLTWAFWGFGMLGLLVGFIFTFPMNWMLVRLGWKHGMGSKEGARVVEERPKRIGLIAAMATLGAAALVLPAWLYAVREQRPLGFPAQQVRAATTLAVLDQGLQETLAGAAAALGQGRRSEATQAIEAAQRVAEVGKAAAPGSAFGRAADEIKLARHELFLGKPAAARARLLATSAALHAARPPAAGTRPPLERFRSVTAVDARGEPVGEVVGMHGDRLELAVGGVRDVWGFLDLGRKRTLLVPVDSVAFGPTRFFGGSLVALPALRKPA